MTSEKFYSLVRKKKSTKSIQKPTRHLCWWAEYIQNIYILQNTYLLSIF